MGERERERAPFRPRSVRAQCFCLAAFLRVRIRKGLERFLGLTFYSGDILPAAPLRFIGLQFLSKFILSGRPFTQVLSFAILSETSSTIKLVKFYPTPNYLPGHQSSNFI